MRGRAKPMQQPLWATPVPDTSRHRLLQRLATLLDLSGAVQRADGAFASTGRPSIPVEQMLKAMLIGYLFGIPSDRQLVEVCADSLACRHFLGLATDAPMFVHASFTHWRQRLGPDYFRDFLHDVVRQCQAHGLRLGTVRTVDASTIKAQAGRDGPVVSLPPGTTIDQYLQQAFAADEPLLPAAADTVPVNQHDPDARLQRKGGEPAEFAYQGSFSADPHSGLIVDATATPTEQPPTMVAHVDHDPGVVTELVADRRYDDGTSLEQLQDRGVTVYVPRADRTKAGQLSKDEFTYEPEHDRYRCPNGCDLDFFGIDRSKRRRRYRSRARDCAACPRKGECARGAHRYIDRHFSEAARERTVRAGPRYRQQMRARRIAEHLFLLAKRDHGMRRARGLGLAAVCIQVALTAIAIDLKKLVRFTTTAPAVVAAARSALRCLGQTVAPRLAPGCRRPLMPATRPAPPDRRWRCQPAGAF